MPRPWLTSASMMLVLPFCSTTFAVGSLSRIACTDRPEKGKPDSLRLPGKQKLVLLPQIAFVKVVLPFQRKVFLMLCHRHNAVCPKELRQILVIVKCIAIR